MSFKHPEDYRNEAAELAGMGTVEEIATQMRGLTLAILYLAEVVKQFLNNK